MNKKEYHFKCIVCEKEIKMEQSPGANFDEDVCLQCFFKQLERPFSIRQYLVIREY